MIAADNQVKVFNKIEQAELISLFQTRAGIFWRCRYSVGLVPVFHRFQVYFQNKRITVGEFKNNL